MSTHDKERREQPRSHPPPEHTTEDHPLSLQRGQLATLPMFISESRDQVKTQDLSEDSAAETLTRRHSALLEPTADYPLNDSEVTHDSVPQVVVSDSLDSAPLIELPQTPCDLEAYTLTQMSAEGGTARIYRAFESHSKEQVAIKLLRRRFHTDTEISTIFRRHGTALKQIQVPHFANILDVGVSPWGPWWALEWVEGQTLREMIDGGKHWNSDQLLQLMYQLCKALEGLHKLGVTHGDLNPKNIMYSPRGRTGDLEHLTLIDVALPVIDPQDLPPLEEGPLLDTEPSFKVFGQPHYIAPECFKGQRPDHRSDLYSLGVILFELTTGALPFTSAMPEVIFEVLSKNAPAASMCQTPWPYPTALDALISNLLSKSPSERFDSITEVKTQVEKMRAHLSERHKLQMTEELTHAELNAAPYQYDDTLSDASSISSRDIPATLSTKRISEITLDDPNAIQPQVLKRPSVSSQTSSQVAPYIPKRSSLKSARRAQNQSDQGFNQPLSRSLWVTNLFWMFIGMALTFLARYLCF